MNNKAIIINNYMFIAIFLPNRFSHNIFNNKYKNTITYRIR